MATTAAPAIDLPARDRAAPPRIVVALLIAALATVALYHALLTASTVVAYGLRFPFIDQYRLNLRYLTIPFPTSILQLENGHRPVVPAFVRIVELRWLDGTQRLEALTAWLAAAASLWIIVRIVRRDLRGRAVAAAAATAAAFTLLLWNANVRMFIHPFEAVHVLYILFFVVLASATALRAGTVAPARWLLAIAACIAATFTFGSGIASFAALAVVAFLRRRGARVVLAIVGAAVLTFALYFFWLPGADGVRGAGSAFSVGAGAFFVFARVGAAIAEITRDFTAALPAQAALAWITGAVASVAVVVSALRRWRRREHFSDLELMGVALFAFGGTVNALLAVNRTGFFFDYPGQVFADRYLFWSCVAWTGIALYGTARAARATPLTQEIAAALVLLFAVAALQPARLANGWAAEVRRITELAAVAMRVGIRDDAELRIMADDGSTPTPAAIDALRERRLAMFAANPLLRVGDRVSLAPGGATAAARVDGVAAPGLAGERFEVVSSILSRRDAKPLRDAVLWLADRDGTVVGEAAMTGPVRIPNALLLGAPSFRQLQGYARLPHGRELAVIAERDGRAIQVATLTITP